MSLACFLTICLLHCTYVLNIYFMSSALYSCFYLCTNVSCIVPIALALFLCLLYGIYILHIVLMSLAFYIVLMSSAMYFCLLHCTYVLSIVLVLPFPVLFMSLAVYLWLLHLTHNPNTQSRLLTSLKKKALENTVGKGENASNQLFLLFPQCFLLYQRV